MNAGSQESHSPHVFGWYALAVAVSQLAMYVSASVNEHASNWLLYYDPRIGLLFLSDLLGVHAWPNVLGWLSAAILAIIGIAVVTHRTSPRLYLWFELTMAALNVFFFVWIWVANLGSAHGFSRGELTIPIVILCFVSLLPCALISRSGR